MIAGAMKEHRGNDKWREGETEVGRREEEERERGDEEVYLGNHTTKQRHPSSLCPLEHDNRPTMVVLRTRDGP